MENTTPTTDPAELTAPHPGECLFCYVDRMITQHDCDTTLRWATRWRDLRLPEATRLKRRLEARGGYCDCEVLVNGWNLRADLEEPEDDDGDADFGGPDPCPGVPSGSDQPCAQWVDVGRGCW